MGFIFNNIAGMGSKDSVSTGSKPKFWKNPFGFFGVHPGRASLMCAMFDIGVGVGFFVLFFYILMKGTLGKDGVYPSKGFNMPRELVITILLLGYYNAAAGLVLYFATGYVRSCLLVWIVLSIPLCIINLSKIYEILAVRNFLRELKQGTVEEDDIFLPALATLDDPIQIVDTNNDDDDGERGKKK